MGLLDLLLLPALGGPKLVQWLAGTLAEQALRESRDEGPIRAQLLELHERFDAGDIGEESYDREEDELLRRLNAIRESKA